MTTKYRSFVQRILDRAVQMPTTAREQFLARVAEARPVVHSEVKSLMPYYRLRTTASDNPPLRVLVARNAASIGRVPVRVEPVGGHVRRYRRPPFNVDQMRVVELIGMGGMGVVYRAEHPTLHRSFAVKMLRPGLDSPVARARFAFEIEILQNLRRVRHPSIPTISYSSQLRTERGNLPFYVMEFIRGTPLTSYAESQSLGFVDRLRLFAGVCSAMAAAHRYDIVHRDLKPDNILVAAESGQPKILDFGIAGITGLETITTRQERGMFVGTLRYASPEQRARRNEDVTPASDVYSLGLIGVELLAGARPGESPIPLRARLFNRASAESWSRGALTPAEVAYFLTAILANALQREVSRRYCTAADLCRDIEALLARLERVGWRHAIARFFLGGPKGRAIVGSTCLDRPLRSVLRNRVTTALKSGHL